MIVPKVSYDWTWGTQVFPWVEFDFGGGCLIRIRYNYKPNVPSHETNIGMNVILPTLSFRAHQYFIYDTEERVMAVDVQPKEMAANDS